MENKLTRESILSLTAGPEIDHLIHDHVMKIVWDETRCPVCGWPFQTVSIWSGCTPGNCSERPVPKVAAIHKTAPYSTDLNEAHKMETELARRDLGSHYRWVLIRLLKDEGFTLIHASALQKCQAALFAVMEETK